MPVTRWLEDQGYAVAWRRRPGPEGVPAQPWLNDQGHYVLDVATGAISDKLWDCRPISWPAQASRASGCSSGSRPTSSWHRSRRATPQHPRSGGATRAGKIVAIS